MVLLGKENEMGVQLYKVGTEIEGVFSRSLVRFVCGSKILKSTSDVCCKPPFPNARGIFFLSSQDYCTLSPIVFREVK